MDPKMIEKTEQWAREAATRGVFDAAVTDAEDEGYREDGSDAFEALDARAAMEARLRNAWKTPAADAAEPHAAVSEADPAVRARDEQAEIDGIEARTGLAHRKMVAYSRNLWRGEAEAQRLADAEK